MRWLHIAVVVIFAVAVLLFLVQNLELVTMSFLGFSARALLALLVATSSTSSAWQRAAVSGRCCDDPCTARSWW